MASGPPRATAQCITAFLLLCSIPLNLFLRINWTTRRETRISWRAVFPLANRACVNRKSGTAERHLWRELKDCAGGEAHFPKTVFTDEERLAAERCILRGMYAAYG